MSAAGRAGLTSAIVVLLAGFVVLSCLSAFGRWDAGRSMWSYRSATWGDALVLPVIVGVLGAALRDDRLRPRPFERRAGIVGGALFAAAGTLVQLSWIAASDPVINWTVPAPHTFSLPGWYHAVFLVLTSTGVGVASSVVGVRVRAAPAKLREDLAGTRAAGSLCGAVIAFGTLLALDSADSVDTSAGQGSMTAAVASVLVVLGLATWLFGARRASLLVIRGAAFGAAICGGAVATNGWPG